jgi:hypothetical protein
MSDIVVTFITEIKCFLLCINVAFPRDKQVITPLKTKVEFVTLGDPAVSIHDIATRVIFSRTDFSAEEEKEEAIDKMNSANDIDSSFPPPRENKV